VALARGGDRLRDDARLAEARAAGDEDGARHALLRGLVDEREDVRHLAIAPHEPRGLAAHAPLARQRGRFALAHEALPVEHPAVLDEGARGLVDEDHALVPAAHREQARRHALDERAHGRRVVRRHRAARAHHHARLRQRVLHEVSEAHEARGAFGRACVRRRGHEHRAVGEHLEALPVLARELAHARLRRGADAIGAGVGLEAREQDREHALLAARDARRREGRRRHVARGRPARLELRELARHHARVARSAGRVLLEHRRAQGVERAGHLGARALHARGLLEEDLREHRERARPRERRAAREALEQHAAEREHVGGGPHVVVTAALLGRHVRGRADRDARGRDGGVRLARAGHTEVEELHARRAPAASTSITFAGFTSRCTPPSA
jgi:hypothetical protein